jgi:hypothetical protein
LARLFRYPLHHATGALLVAWAAASALFIPAAQLQGVTALGTGFILWLSAAVTLAIALQSIRQPASQPVGLLTRPVPRPARLPACIESGPGRPGSYSAFSVKAR